MLPTAVLRSAEGAICRRELAETALPTPNLCINIGRSWTNIIHDQRRVAQHIARKDSQTQSPLYYTPPFIYSQEKSDIALPCRTRYKATELPAEEDYAPRSSRNPTGIAVDALVATAAKNNYNGQHHAHCDRTENQLSHSHIPRQ